jgi:hypothetical protein
MEKMSPLSILKSRRLNIKSQITAATEDLSEIDTSNIFHFFFTVVTGGLWITIWVICAIISIKQRKSVEKRLVKLNRSLNKLESEIEDEIETGV